jgi:CRP/FNR family transcriptional regulator, cyclic AMP receptor protein
MSSSSGPGLFASCRVLEEDPELAEVIPRERRAEAIEACTAAEIYFPVGAGLGRPADVPADGFGLLILSGLIIRRAGVDGRFGAELLGDGDLLRPWQDEYDSATLPLQTGWGVIERARLAVLDEQFVRRVAAYPELGPAMVARVMRRARHLAINMAIVHQARVDVRLHMLLWHLAGRWGRVRSEGTVVPLRLTHALLADLVAARRPTVTSALSDLTRRGLLRTSGDEWVLLGEPPGELLGLGASLPGGAWAERLASGRGA